MMTLPQYSGPSTLRCPKHARQTVQCTLRNRRSTILRAVSVPVTEPLTATSTTNDGDADHRGAPSTGPSSNLSAATPAPYNWARNWVPVSPVSYLDPLRPTPVTLLGESLVVWHHAGRQEWVVMRDVCPHRLAPLSEGRLEGGGTRLACAYHGWEFSERGDCTRVPQLAADTKAAATACASPRACVTSFPTRVEDGVMYAWLDASPEGLQLAAAASPPKHLSDDATPVGDWLMNELPNDYSFWVEQGMDPAHANFLHHGTAVFNQYDYVPMDCGLVNEMDLVGGWRWEHRGYEKKNKDMRAVRQHVPPFTMRTEYEQPSGSVTSFCTLQVPVRPGVSRVYFRAGFSKRQTQGQTAEKLGEAAGSAAGGAGGSSVAAASTGAPAVGESVGGNGAAAGRHGAAPSQEGQSAAQPRAERKKAAGGGGGVFALLQKLPHWVTMPHPVTDQDTIMMCKQELLMRGKGLDWRSYHLNSRSDEGVSAINRWLQMAGYPDSLWGARPAASRSGHTYPGWPDQELPLEAILSRRERHVRHCAVCQRGEKIVTRACAALTAAAAMAAVAAVTMAMVAATSAQGVAVVGGWKALAGVVGAAAVLAWAAVQGWAFREERFVSGLPNWRSIGGFAVLHKQMKK